MSRGRDALLFGLLALVWGSAFTAIKVGLDHLPPVLFASFRYDIAAVLMVAYAAVATDDWRPRTRADWTTVAVGGVLLIALYNAFLFVGETGVTSAVAAILVATSPVLTTGVSRVLIPSQRLTTVGLVGLALGFVGVGLVVRPDPSSLLTADLIAPGFVLLAALCTALGSVLVQRGDHGISTEGMVAWSNALGALLLHAISFGLPSESIGQAAFTLEAVVALAYLAVFASALGYFVYFRLLDRLGAIEINLVSYAAPVFAAATGWLLRDETLDPLAIVGFVVIFLGFVLLKRNAIRSAVASARAAG